ncbi:hypothetical protein GCM10010372_13530 [Streptomyces tauricus]|nr:hypothetical protein GCM10010372_13530 [Streptomyces tauricus]
MAAGDASGTVCLPAVLRGCAFDSNGGPGERGATPFSRRRRPYPFPSLTQGLRPRTPGPQTPDGLKDSRTVGEIFSPSGV